MVTRNLAVITYHVVCGVAITINHLTVQLLEIPHLSLRFAKVIVQPAIEAAQFIRKSMFLCLIMLDLRITMSKLATQKMMPPHQIILVFTPSLPSGQRLRHPSPSSESYINNAMTLFLEEFKPLINPLIALLTKVISSLLDKKITNTATKKSFLVLLFNANGLKNHILEL